MPWLLRWSTPPGRTTFAAALHAGSCAGVAWALRRDLRSLDRRTTALLAAASVPAAVAGAVAADAVEERLGRPHQLAWLLAGAGVLLALADRRPAARAAVGDGDAAAAALAQVAALVPGVSRSGAVLTALRARGVAPAAAVRFSLLLSLPITGGAAGLTLARADRALLSALGRPLLVGVPASAVSAALGTSVVLRRPGSTRVAVLYRLGLAAGVVVRLHRRKGSG